jgi:hypothetical protein
MPDDLRIIKTTEEYLPADGGKFIKHVRVSYKVGDDGPFTRDFPADGFNPATARVVLEQHARDIKALRGVY